MGNNNFISIKQLAVSALSIALATVLSMIKVYEFPFGGSITLFSMLFICLPGMLYGLPIGLAAGFVYGIIQFMLGAYVVSPIQVAVDYFFAFTALGLSGLFYKNKNYLNYGYIIGIIGRFVFAVISGYVFFAEYAWKGWNPLAYSLCYNAAYIFSEGIITLIVINIPLVKKNLQRLRFEIEVH